MALVREEDLIVRYKLYEDVADSINEHNGEIINPEGLELVDVDGRKGIRFSGDGPDGYIKIPNEIYDIEVKNQEGVTVPLFRWHSRTIRGQVIETGERS